MKKHVIFHLKTGNLLRILKPFTAIILSACLLAEPLLSAYAGPGFPAKLPVAKPRLGGPSAFSTFNTTLPHITSASYRYFASPTSVSFTAPNVTHLADHVSNTAAASQLLFSRTNIHTITELPKALSFWRNDAQQRARQLLASSPHLFALPTPSVSSDTQTVTATAQLADLVTDIAALGVYGSKQDVPLLLDLHKQLASTQFATPVTTATARALLRLRAYQDLQTVAYRHPNPAGIWNGIYDYAKRNNVRLPPLPAKRQLETPTSIFTDLLAPFGQVTTAAVDPSYAATLWYMQLGKKPVTHNSRKFVPPITQNRHVIPSTLADLALPPLEMSFPKSLSLTDNFRFPAQSSFANAQPRALSSPSEQDSTKLQRRSLYAASFVMGFELGQPIIASVGEALNLSLPENILVSVATFAPYALGSFWASHLQQKIGNGSLLPRGLWLLGTSLAIGAAGLGLDGNFQLWEHPKAHFYSILSIMTLASLGSTMMHCAVGPMMSSLSKNAPEAVRERRTANTELGQAAGLLTSYLLPFAATRWLGMDWSAPFFLSLPLVAAAAFSLRHIPPPDFDKIQQKTTQTATKIKKLKDNVYVKLFKEDKNLGKLVGGLALVNGIEASLNSGFLLMLPELTNNASSQYLWGLGQFALPFALGSFLGTRLLKMFPNKNMAISAAITAAGAVGAMFSLHNLPALMGTLALAELGLSSAYTLSFARSAKNPKTQGRVASLLVASTLSAAVMPFMLSSLAQGIIDAGWMSLPTALATTMIGLPGLLSVSMWRLFHKMENPFRSVKKK